ncbi:MAG: TlpA family protein disulfide reductase [Gemmatimonadetes bacterium]|nr:TlpA family protein disulfide reductase [Gemmatimonadota bacterium]
MRRAVAAVAVAIVACRPEPGTLVGDVAPPYAATTLSGDSVSTTALKGKVVLLNVWATWCAPCREEIPYLQSLHEQHAASGLELVGVSVDTQGEDETIRGFMRDFGMTYPVWRDPDERVQTLFQALGVPSSYLIDRAGVIRWRRLGIIRQNDSTFTQALQAALTAPPG